MAHRTVATTEVNDAMRRNENLMLINVLPEETFETEHIPGSHNIPLGHPQFVAEVERLAGSKGRRIVVHCSGPSCQSSAKAAERLEQAGFSDVTHFAGGMEEWKKAGLAVESGTPAGRPR